MPELVVAPSMVMASPIVGTNIAIPQAQIIIMNVQMKFYWVLNFFLDSPMTSSSIESLAGSTQKGEAKSTTISISRRHTLIVLLSPYRLEGYSADP